ncbi:MAG TPA: AraC family transcriptional regulator [Bauldia sp.]|nr:AraC family transcriptional regulator [Bauldia sp.]
MKTIGIGRVIFWGGGSLWIGLAVDPVAPHAHHALQIAVGFDGPVEFRTDPGAGWTSYAGGALIRPDTPHEFRAPGRRVATIMFEPETALGRALLERFPGDAVVPLATEVTGLAAAFDRGLDDHALAGEGMRFLSRLAGTAWPQKPADARIVRAIDWIARHIDGPIGLAGVAAVAGLSEGRFRHLFVEETGIAFRPYVLWTRLNRALEMGFGGTSWTEAAHATGFADSAHLTRTCRRMYGLVPSSPRIDRTAQDRRRIA